MTYWHYWELRHPMREIASRYPKTYKKVGDQLREMGLVPEWKKGEDYKKLLLKQWIATLAAMPPHVQPYRDIHRAFGGNTKTWGEQDWTPIFDEIFEGIKEEEDSKRRVNRYTRAPRDGREIQCSYCDFPVRVYHFSWCAAVCQGCHRDVEKGEWLIVEPKEGSND